MKKLKKRVKFMLSPVKTTPKHSNKPSKGSLVLKSIFAKKKSQNNRDKIDSIIKSVTQEHSSSSRDFIKKIS